MIVFCFVCRKYQPIKSYDQRCKYKQEFQAQYKEYRELKENVDSVSMKFSELDRLRRKYPDDSDEAQVKGHFHLILCLKFACERFQIACECSQCDFDLFAMFDLLRTFACG